MSTSLLDESIDIHTGGVDNIFPHHECEIAQSESVFGKPFVKYWVHKGYLNVEGEKMSKSKGNFYTLRDLEERGYDPVLFRYLVVSSHYRSPVNFSFQGLEEAKASIERLEEFYRFIHKLKPTHGPSHEELKKLLKEAKVRFNEKLSDDLNTPEALAEVFLFVKNVYKLNLNELAIPDRIDIIEFLKAFNEIFGILELSELSDVEKIFSPEVLALRSQRIEAKKNKDYAMADKLRDEIQSMGYKVIDNPDGSMTLEQQGKW
jgi:cysteinyl-tRNA synthetase